MSRQQIRTTQSGATDVSMEHVKLTDSLPRFRPLPHQIRIEPDARKRIVRWLGEHETSELERLVPRWFELGRNPANFLRVSRIREHARQARNAVYQLVDALGRQNTLPGTPATPRCGAGPSDSIVATLVPGDLLLEHPNQLLALIIDIRETASSALVADAAMKLYELVRANQFLDEAAAVLVLALTRSLSTGAAIGISQHVRGSQLTGPQALTQLCGELAAIERLAVGRRGRPRGDTGTEYVLWSIARQQYPGVTLSRQPRSRFMVIASAVIGQLSERPIDVADIARALKSDLKKVGPAKFWTRYPLSVVTVLSTPPKS